MHPRSWLASISSSSWFRMWAAWAPTSDAEKANPVLASAMGMNAGAL
ncbi:hypothetical protein HZ993_11670 [Rhodoferax sp. AJA081-3]|nr:hypothetical protein [Rhodoferax sp. AJA081-3]QTN30386.1 hypothetical protein HZ993_11670 [Rhodoferax sp. AJA081-3]